MQRKQDPSIKKKVQLHTAHDTTALICLHTAHPISFSFFNYSPERDNLTQSRNLPCTIDMAIIKTAKLYTFVVSNFTLKGFAILYVI